MCNIKCSVKVPIFKSLTQLQEKCLNEKHWHCRKFNSYLVIRPQDSIRFIIFKPRTNSMVNHINLTGIRDREILNHAVELLLEFLECSSDSIDVKVDNISAKSNQLYNILQTKSNEKFINLNSLIESLKGLYSSQLNLTFNTDIFCALIIRENGVTSLVYIVLEK